MIYEGTISWTINDDTGNNNQVETTNSIYVTKRDERLISIQHLVQNATPANTDATTLDDTWRVTHHDRVTLIWGGGRFVCTVPIENQNIFTLQTLLNTLRSKHIVLMLVVTHIYMMIRLTVSLTNFLF